MSGQENRRTLPGEPLTAGEQVSFRPRATDPSWKNPKSGSSETGDFSDVKVVSPYGEIPWTKVSRFNDDEMKELMIDVVDHCYDFLLMLFNHPMGDDMVELLKTTDVKKDWQDPTVIAN
jgi:ligand-binding SRPBCC domain-containing protein